MGILCVSPTSKDVARRYQPIDRESLREMASDTGRYSLKSSNVIADKIMTVPPPPANPNTPNPNASQRVKRAATSADLYKPLFRKALATTASENDDSEQTFSMAELVAANATLFDRKTIWYLDA